MSSIRKNLSFNIIYQILTYILPLITTPYLSRVLGAEGIGSYSYNFSIAYYFVMFGMLGMSNYGSRTIAQEQKDKVSYTFWCIFVMQLITASAMLLLYVGYCLCFGDGIYSYVFIFYVASAVFDISWLFFGLEEFRITTVTSALIKIISLICIFVFVKTSDDLIKYFVIMCCSFLFTQVPLWFFLRKRIRFCRVKLKDVFHHFKPNILLFVPVLAISVYKMMDKTMLGALANNIEVGYYGNSEKILQIPTGIITAVGAVMLPRMSNVNADESLTSDDKTVIQKRYFDFGVIFSACFSSAMSFGIIAISKEFVPWFFGNEFNECKRILSVMMPSSIFLALANVLRTQVLIPQKKDSIYILSVCMGAVINLIFNIILIPKYNAFGAAIATLLAEFIVFLIQFIFSFKLLSDRKVFLSVIPFYIFGLIMLMVLYYLDFQKFGNFITIVFKVSIGALVFLVLSCIYYFLFLRKKYFNKQ